MSSRATTTFPYVERMQAIAQKVDTELFPNTKPSKNGAAFNLADQDPAALAAFFELLDLGEHYHQVTADIPADNQMVLKTEYADNPLAACPIPLYHGITRMQNVCLNALEGLLFDYGKWNKDAKYRLECGPGKEVDMFLTLRALMLAALYRGVGHSLGASNDDANVIRAISIYQQEAARVKSPHRDLPIISHLIAATKQPLLSPNVFRGSMIEDSVFQKLGPILRDASAMSVYLSDNEQLADLYIGMFLETKLRLPHLKISQFSFEEGRGWVTDWAMVKDQELQWGDRHRALYCSVNEKHPLLADLASRGIISL